MKDFLVGWIVFQLFIVGLAGAIADSNPGDKSRTVDCSSWAFAPAVMLIDLTVPLLQFSDLGVRECTPGSLHQVQ
jgi:hypothetical protein